MRRVLPIIIAVVLAIIAAIIVFVYTRGAEQRVLAQQEPTSVLVSTGVIPKGMALADAVSGGLAETQTIPSAMTPAGAITAVTAENGALLALNDINPGLILLDGNFVVQLPDATPLDVPDGQMAVSLTLGDPERVGTFVRPGSQVVIFDTYTPVDAAAANGPTTRVLLDRVTVLAVGDTTEMPRSSSADGQQITPSALLTVAVDQQQAQKLIQAIRTGSLYFGLLGEGTDVVKSSGATASNLFD